MPLMLLSNPGLHLALLGNPKRSGKRAGKKSFGFATRKLWTQAKRRAIARVGRTFKIKGGGRYKVHSSGSTGYHRAGRPRIHAPGISWSGRKGGIGYTGTISRRGKRSFARWTNPRHHRKPRKHTMSRRRNPFVGDLVANVKSIPNDIKATFSGPKVIKNVAFAAGAGVGCFMLGGMLIKMLKDKGPAAVQAQLVGNPQSDMKLRVINASAPLLVGVLAAIFIKDKTLKTAIIAGSAIAAAVEVAKPGMVGDTLAMVTGGIKTASTAALPPAAAATVNTAVAKVEEVAKTNGLLGAYADVPSYQGSAGLAGLLGYTGAPAYSGSAGLLGAYADVPSYSGTGEYTDVPSYSGTGDLASDDLAGPNDLADDTVLAGLGTYLNDSVAAQSGSYLN